MDFVYDYMFHLLTEYAKLLKFEPTIPPGAVEVCSETMACPEEDGLWNLKNFMVESMVKSPRDTLPCTMPPPYDLPALEAIFPSKQDILREVGMWENEHSENNKLVEI